MAYGITGLTGQSAHSLVEQEVKKETELAMVHTMMELIALGNLMRNVIATLIHVQVRCKIHLKINALTLCILTDSSFWFDTIHLEWSVVYK